jgi:hypothetical protein
MFWKYNLGLAAPNVCGVAEQPAKQEKSMTFYQN